MLENLEPVYFPGDDDIVKDLFLPVSSVSTAFDCLSGYFTSSLISELAEPLSILFSNPLAQGRFVIGPQLNSEDKKNLLEAYSNKESIFDYLVGEDGISEESLVSSTLDVIKYLITSGRLSFKIAIKKEGIMHAKIWNFTTEFGSIAIHGSGNATASGVMRNFEQLVFSREWSNSENKKIVAMYKEKFESFWSDSRADSYVIDLNDETIRDIFSATNTSVDGKYCDDLLVKMRAKVEEESKVKNLSIPSWLKYREGDYKHQGEAVDAWLNNGKKGILDIATGGGKTLTSLVCSALALNDHRSSVLIIAVPTRPLIKQWAGDVNEFGITPLDTEGISTKGIVRLLNNIFRKQRSINGVDVIILTHAAIKNDLILSVMAKSESPVMLIADEMHNLGVARFLESDASVFTYKLGLSATPERQYDSEGTAKLLDYMGGVVYRFTLEDAIGKCLVPFSYHLHEVFLNAEEEDKWLEYTEKIKALMWNREDQQTKSLIDRLLIRRRAIIESAYSKVDAFNFLVSNIGKKKYTLVFCTDKNPEQLEAVNIILKNNNILYHQITGDETGDKNLMRDLVESYKSGGIECLTSKRVLDEGFNIPPIEKAYFLASSGTKRTWVQRLGRVLRMSPETGKEIAEIHDFVVLPIGSNSAFKPIIESELERVQWFSSLALNGAERGGSVDVLTKLAGMLEEE